ncbi:hypothetical protein CROQUDRAFT_51402, partial [Cronartium quercuum f. sp. fusiforme G11]
KQFLAQHGKQIAVSYIQVPLATIVVLFFAYLVDLLIALLPFTFPSSAILIFILFLFMIGLHWISFHKLSKWFHKFFGPAADFLLGQMGLFFTSSFILIPRRASISGKKIGLLCALFIPSFLISWTLTIVICRLLKLSQGKKMFTDPGPDSEKVQTVELGHTDQELSDQLPQGLDISHQTVVDEPSSATMFPNRHLHLQLHINPTMTCNVTRVEVDDDLEKSSIEESAEEVIVRRMAKWFDPLVYFIIFLIGLPLFFTPNGHTRSLPLFLGTVSLAWIFSRRAISTKWQKVLHPIIVTSALTILVIWIFGKIKGMTLPHVLAHYSTGNTYLILFRYDKGYDGRLPGSGDVMATLLVAGIVCLSFPLFRYRQDLFSEFFRLLVVILPNCALALLLWPFLARLMGMDGERAVTFVGRFMSTPFGIQLIDATGGDEGLEVVLICVTGILAVLVRDPLFRLFRVRVKPGSSEDYFTMGTTIGVIGGAIGTSSLLQSHPRAAATASVTFVIYGMVLLTLVAVPAIATFVGTTLAGI